MIQFLHMQGVPFHFLTNVLNSEIFSVVLIPLLIEFHNFPSLVPVPRTRPSYPSLVPVLRTRPSYPSLVPVPRYVLVITLCVSN